MFELPSELYYCKAWKHQIASIKKHKFDICVSDAIAGNKLYTLLQYHILIQKDGDVVRPSQLGNTSKSKESLHCLEAKIKETATKTFDFSDTLELENIKIWYYPKLNDSEIRGDPHLRIAVTIANIIEPNLAKQTVFQQTLNDLIWKWVRGQGDGSSVSP